MMIQAASLRNKCNDESEWKGLSIISTGLFSYYTKALNLLRYFESSPI